MKYVKQSAGIVFCLAALMLAGCGGQPVKISALEKETQYELQPTLEYIPQLDKAEEAGKFLPYEPAENPYVTRGRIKKSSVAAFIEARQAFKDGDYDKAEKLFKSLAEADDSLSGPWVMLGDIALKRDDRESAKEHYLKAITVNKDNINAWLRLAYIQRLQGQYLAAQNTYVDALKVWQDCPEAHLNLAVLYDLYLNLPIRAQRHMEAYLFLKEEPQQRVVDWLNNLQSRTGMAVALPLKDGVPDQSLLVSK